jgi:glycosyltransferase involved in cell wall biosynthesis
MRQLAAKVGVHDRVRFLGSVTREELLALYANAAATAMLSSKPVTTCSDSGGPLEFVLHGETGVVDRLLAL